jgi:hypothetical protein
MRKFRVWLFATSVLLATLLATLLASQSHASLQTTPEAFTEQTSAYPAFYTIEEPTDLEKETLPRGSSAGFTTNNYMQPVDKMFSMEGMAIQARQAAVSLLRWALHKKAAPAPKQAYDRVGHFGRWINDPNDETCYNTRSKVLIRDSKTPVSFRSQNHCVVDRGQWNEPYKGQKVIQSSGIQIDHMVPLKNAYISGAWQWNFQTRCMYANFMGNNFHLISADAVENMRKGERGPNLYLPPAQTYRCKYIENWLKIKLIWRLTMTQEEVAAIHDQIKENKCNPTDFVLSDQEIKTQRKLIYSHPEMCPERRPQQDTQKQISEVG